VLLLLLLLLFFVCFFTLGLFLILFIIHWLMQLEFPSIAEGLQPRHRFMSAFEQKIEPADKNFQ
jgi:hypothetical protein